MSDANVAQPELPVGTEPASQPSAVAEPVAIERHVLSKAPAQIGLLLSWVLLMWLSYPWPNQWWAAHLALIPFGLFVTYCQQRWKLVVFSYLAGYAWWAIQMAWLFHVVAYGLLALAAMFAFYVLGFAMIFRFALKRTSYPCALLIPLIWVGMEMIRGTLVGEVSVPLYMIGHSQPTVLIQIADALGAYGVSFFVAMTAGAAVDLILWRLGQQPGIQERRIFSRVYIPVSLLVLGWVAVVGYGQYRIQQTDRFYAHADSIKVAVVQTDVPQSNKIRRTEEEKIEHFAQMALFTADASAEGAEIVVWPETIYGWPIDDQSVEYVSAFELRRDQLHQMVDRLNIHLVVGAHVLYWQIKTDEYGQEYPAYLTRANGAYVLKPGMRNVQIYEKIHRVPFGEFLPWVEMVPSLKEFFIEYFTPYDSDYSLKKGTEFDAGMAYYSPEGVTWRIGTPICFEDIVSYVSRYSIYGTGEKSGDILVNLTNDGWFPDMSEGPVHEQIARFRCVENRVFMARSVNRGISGFIDSAGRIVKNVEVDGKKQSVAGWAMYEVKRDPRSTIFGRHGDWFGWLCFLCVLGLLCYGLVPKIWQAKKDESVENSAC